MTRAGAKLTLVALSLAATLGGWAALAGREREPMRAASAAPLAALPRAPATVPATPTGQAVGPAAPTITGSTPSGAASVPRPIARTRSSR